MTAGEIKAQMVADFGDKNLEEYLKPSEDTGIREAKTAATGNNAYNLAGQQVDKGFKGLVISNGKKYVVK